MYDSTGRLLDACYHYWDTWNTGTSSYNTSNIVGNTCEYEFTGLDRGLKTESDYYNGNGSSWTNYSTETYGYDASLDYLTSAAYTDGGSASWTYDAAGNRTDSGVDNLNRTTSIGGQATSCDILGNRLTLGSNVSYGWDCLNRMTSYTNSGVSNSYWYRADGMRVAKLVGSSGTTTTYRYDGQMGFEDVDTAGSGTTVTDYGVGARGIDYISSNPGSGANVGFPLYDGHGNMIGTLARSGQGSYTTGNVREYDAWGSVRSGQSTGDPKGRYCANLGHKADDESGLTYVRARYYDSFSGRFISEDSNRSWLNWYAYTDDDPINKVDEDGHDALSLIQDLVQAALFLMGEVLLDMWSDAAKQISNLTRWIDQLEALIGENIKVGGNEVDLAQMKIQLKENQAILQRAKFIKGMQGILKLIGYMQIIKAFLMDIDLVDGRSGLDILLGQ